jgi:hypothetical protein
MRAVLAELVDVADSAREVVLRILREVVPEFDPPTHAAPTRELKPLVDEPLGRTGSFRSSIVTQEES